MNGVPYVPIFESLPGGLSLISGKEAPGTPDLLKVASSILERDATGLHSTAPDQLVPAQSLPAAGEADHLSQRAHELLAGLFAAFGRPQGGTGYGGKPASVAGASHTYGSAAGYGGRTCPVTHAAVPLGGFDADSLRRQLHEVIRTLLTAFKDSTDEQALPDHPTSVRLLSFPAPVPAGSKGCRSLTVANEEHTPSEVTLYSTNFVADTGYDIPSVQVSASPRRQTIPARGRANFEIEIQVPQQAPAGIYSGLIQAMGTKYVKAVLSVEVQ